MLVGQIVKRQAAPRIHYINLSLNATTVTVAIAIAIVIAITITIAKRQAAWRQLVDCLGRF